MIATIEVSNIVITSVIITDVAIPAVIVTNIIVTAISVANIIAAAISVANIVVTAVPLPDIVLSRITRFLVASGICCLAGDVLSHTDLRNELQKKNQLVEESGELARDQDSMLRSSLGFARENRE